MQCGWVWKPRMLRPEQPVEQLVAPRADAEALRVRPGDVPEGEDRRAGQALADHPRQRARSGSPARARWGRRRRPPRTRRRRTCGSRAGSAPSPRARNIGPRVRRCGRAARAPRSRSRSSSPSPPRRSSQTPPQRRRTPRRAGRARGRSRPTVSRSAEPLPCATQTPEQARITGSSAVTRPLAGCTTRDVAVRRALVDVGLAVRDDDDALAVEVRGCSVSEPLRRPRPPAVRPPAPRRGGRRGRGRRAGAAGTPGAASRRESRRSSRSSLATTARRATSVTIEAARARITNGEAGTASRRLAALDEAQVVDEDHEAEGSPSSTTGTAVTCTRPPGSGKTPRPCAQVADSSGAAPDPRPRGSCR